MALVLRDRDPFRFLDLLPEIRNQIYRYCLSAEHVKEIDTPWDRNFRYHFQVSLLRVSRQVREEAEYIFHNDNLFVLVTINLDISSIFHTLIWPIVLAWCDRAESFRHHAIALDLSFSRPTSFIQPDLSLLPEYSDLWSARFQPFMIAGKNMPWLVRALSTIDGIYEGSGCPLLPNTYLSISALGPIKDATTRETGRSQDDLRLGKLLEPLFCQGIPEAYLDASVSADYADRIVDKIEEIPLRVEASVDRATTLTRTGDEAFRCGRHATAIRAYQEALDCLLFFYGFIGAWRHDGCYAVGLPTDIFSDLFNRQRAARIRLEIGRKALEPAFLALSRAHRLNKLARAGFDYAIDHFDNCDWPQGGVNTHQGKRVGVELDIQLGIIIDFESDSCMKIALETLRVSTKDSNFNYESRVLWSCPWSYWDGWILET